MDANPRVVTCPECGTKWEIEEAEASQGFFLCTECTPRDAMGWAAFCGYGFI
jgi:predicted  nucleic acid-binding Zn ribbon protein